MLLNRCQSVLLSSLRYALIVGLVAFLSGCGGEPSNLLKNSGSNNTTTRDKKVYPLQEGDTAKVPETCQDDSKDSECKPVADDKKTDSKSPTQ